MGEKYEFASTIYDGLLLPKATNLFFCFSLTVLENWKKNKDSIYDGKLF